MDLTTLSAQRWFAGKGREVTSLQPSAEVGGLTVLDVGYADGLGDERYLLVGADVRWATLLRTLRSGPARGGGASLELRPGPALESLLAAGDEQRHISLDQSNTLVLVGSRLLVKAYRNLRGGPHPEVEVLAALAGSAAPVPAYGGSLVLREDGGEQTTLVLLQEYAAGAASGWEAMIAPAAARLRGEPAAESGISFADAGAAAAVLHRVLADRLGVGRVDAAEIGWPRQALRALDRARELEPTLDAATVAQITARLAPLEHLGRPLVQRIHGDLNLAQLLFGPAGVRIVDFEGNPMLPLARRRGRDLPARDLATLLRSIDHVGFAAARRAGGIDPGEWIAAARADFLTAYEREADASPHADVLHALELVAECDELAYAHRVVPEWAYVARAGLNRLLSR